MNKTSLTLAIVSLAATALPAIAGESYIVGSVGRSTANINQGNFDAAQVAAGAAVSTSTVDQKDNGYKLLFGYQYTPNFAFEAGYVDLGKANYSATLSDTTTASADWKAHGWNFAALGIVPVSKELSVFGKLGVIDAKVESNLTPSSTPAGASGSVSTTKWSPNYGVGATYAFTPATAVRVEWERFQNLGDDTTLGKTNVNLASAGLVVKF